MKMKKTKRDMVRGLATVAAVAALAGCMSSPVTFCTSSVPVEQGKYSVLGPEVAGTCTQVNWLFFSFGLGGSGQRHALRDALGRVPGADALVGMAVDEEYFMLVPFALPSFFTTRVTGTPVKMGRND